MEERREVGGDELPAEHEPQAAVIPPDRFSGALQEIPAFFSLQELPDRGTEEPPVVPEAAGKFAKGSPPVKRPDEGAEVTSLVREVSREEFVRPLSVQHHLHVLFCQPHHAGPGIDRE